MLLAQKMERLTLCFQKYPWFQR